MGMSIAARQELKEVYERNWPALMKTLGPIAKQRKLSSPFLVDPDAHAYSKSPLRWMAVAQQAREWEGTLGDHDVEGLLKTYRDFRLGYNYPKTPIVQALHALNCLLNPEGPEDGFLWTNLVRLDEDGRRPSDSVLKNLVSVFNVLPDEIRIASPDVVVFFTGLRYDEHIEKTFCGCHIEPVSGHCRRELAVLKHPGLPPATYRTYHPQYLRRGKKWHLIEEIACLAQEALGGCKQRERPSGGCP